MVIADVLISQYRAALAMIQAAIEGCPQALWDNPSDRNRFWHVAYHAGELCERLGQEAGIEIGWVGMVHGD